MDLIWLAEALQKILKEKKESLEDLIKKRYHIKED